MSEIEVTVTCTDCGGHELGGEVADVDKDYEPQGLVAGLIALHQKTCPGHRVEITTETIQKAHARRTREVQAEHKEKQARWEEEIKLRKAKLEATEASKIRRTVWLR
jgi:hypothetical protein